MQNKGDRGAVVMKLAAMDKAELRRVNQEAASQYEDFKALHVSLNMARGKPCAKQLDLALGVLEALKARSEFANSNGDDSRNYGIWNGLPEMREIFSTPRAKSSCFAQGLPMASGAASPGASRST